MPNGLRWPGTRKNGQDRRIAARDIQPLVAFTTLSRLLPAADIAVLGSGPAGATVARLLGEAGHDVVLLGGLQRMRGRQIEALHPHARPLIEALDLYGRLQRANFMRSAGCLTWGLDDEPVEERYASRLAGPHLTRRQELDDLLLVVAARRASVVLDGMVTTIDLREPDCASIACEQRGEHRTLTVRLAIDCTGRAGLIARQGHRRPEPGHATAAVAGIWKATFDWPLPEPSLQLFEVLDEGWASSLPATRIERCFAVYGEAAGVPRNGRGAGVNTAIDRTRYLRSLLPHGKAFKAPWVVDASLYSADRLVGPNWLLCGDAASTVDPFVASGLEKALASAQMAAIVANACLTRRGVAADACELYERREREAYVTALEASVRRAREIAARRPDSPFWRRRAGTSLHGRLPLSLEARCKTDPAMLAAVERLRENERARIGADIVRIESRPAFDGRKLVFVDAMVLPAAAASATCFDGVHLPVLVALVREAPRDLAWLFDAYHRHAPATARSHPPVDYAAFLNALALLVSNRALRIIP